MKDLLPANVFLAAIAMLQVYSIAHAQTHSLSVGDDSIIVDVIDARPLSAALQLVSAEYEFPLDMTYEDPRYVYEGDLVGLTPTMLGLRGNKVLSTIIAVSGKSKTRENFVEAIATLVEIQNTSGDGARFRVEESSDIIHILPVAFRGETGRVVGQDAILDTRITIEAQQLSGLGMLRAIQEAISLSSGGTFSSEPGRLLGNTLHAGRVPLSMLSNYRGVLEAKDEPAREVIMRMLRAVDSGPAWQLFVTFEPTYKNYWINIRAIFPPAESFGPQDSPALQQQDRTRENSRFAIPEAEIEDVLRQLQEEGRTSPPPLPTPIE